MALRMVEISVPAELADDVHQVMSEDPPLVAWSEHVYGDGLVVRLVLDAGQTGPAVDRFEKRLGGHERFRLTISAVEAALPRMAEAEEAAPGEAQAAGEASASPAGISREELHSDVWDMTDVSRVMIVTAMLSSVVAAVGMMRDNVAAIIGAMVIAPLLGPNVGLALATTLADAKLLRRALWANLLGSGAALALAIGVGLLFEVDPRSPELAARLQVSLSDIALALAAGTAAVLALTTGVAAALVGVMLAVALVPPLVAVGLMIGDGRWSEAGGAALLLATNVICVNLAGTITFLAKGVGPLSWWEKDRARKLSRVALATWLVLLAALAVLILLL